MKSLKSLSILLIASLSLMACVSERVVEIEVMVDSEGNKVEQKKYRVVCFSHNGEKVLYDNKHYFADTYSSGLAYAKDSDGNKEFETNLGCVVYTKYWSNKNTDEIESW